MFWGVAGTLVAFSHSVSSNSVALTYSTAKVVGKVAALTSPVISAASVVISETSPPLITGGPAVLKPSGSPGLLPLAFSPTIRNSYSVLAESPVALALTALTALPLKGPAGSHGALVAPAKAASSISVGFFPSPLALARLAW